LRAVASSSAVASSVSWPSAVRAACVAHSRPMSLSRPWTERESEYDLRQKEWLWLTKNVVTKVASVSK
jgi:hypothetical protein